MYYNPRKIGVSLSVSPSACVPHREKRRTKEGKLPCLVETENVPNVHVRHPVRPGGPKDQVTCKLRGQERVFQGLGSFGELLRYRSVRAWG